MRERAIRYLRRGLPGVLGAVAVVFAGCGAADPDEVQADPSDYLVEEGDGKADGTPAAFDKNLIVRDVYFRDSGWIDEALVQSIFDKTPYGTRSWLADFEIGERSAAEVIVSAARERGLNPLVLVARAQQEKGLVSKTTRPAARYVDWAFGCGCYDGQACFERYRGFDKQVACAAEVFAEKYADSEAGDGLWNKGRTRKTVDDIAITPQSHATAAIYAYTPLVNEGTGGSWLTWNINRRYERYIAALRQAVK